MADALAGWSKSEPGKTRAVMDGLMTLDEYRTREKEYLEIMRKPRKSFGALNGEYCAASKFSHPCNLRTRCAKMRRNLRFTARVAERRQYDAFSNL